MAGETLVVTESKPKATTAKVEAKVEAEADSGPKRRGWWSRAIGGS
jgi:hypothetical protein